VSDALDREAEQALEQEAETAVDAIVDTTKVFTGPPELSSLALWNFCVDTAQKIHGYTTIATRYGFTDWREMADFLATNEAVRRKVKELRAVWEADDSVEVRLRKLAGHGLLEALPTVAQNMFDSTSKAAQIDTTKTFSKIAGVDGLPPVGRDGQVPGQAQKFSVSIIFGSTGKIENFSTVENATPVLELEPT
jgi:hypothetical protein